RLLHALAPWCDAAAWRVAFSGGLDSTVLLHLLAELRERETLPPLSAIHVAHGLQAAAEPWPAHCRAVCERLGIALQVVRSMWIAMPPAWNRRRARRAMPRSPRRCGPAMSCSPPSIATTRPRRCCFACCAAPACVAWAACRHP